MKQVLNNHGILIDTLVSYDNLTRLCKETKPISQKEIENLVKALNALIQKL